MRTTAGVGSYLFLSLLAKRRTIAFYSLVVLLLVVGVGLLVFQSTILEYAPHFPIVLGEEIGKALIVAGILAGSVDIYLKRRLATDFARDVSPFIEGFGLPPEFQDEIAFIKRIPLYRRNYQLTYRIFSDASLLAGYVRARTTMQYEVINPTDSPQTFQLGLAVEDAHPTVGKARIISAGMRGEAIDEIAPTATDVAVKTKFENGFYVYSQDVLLPASKSPATAWIEGESFHEENDIDVVYMMYATTNLTVHVEAPNGIDVSVYFGHRYQEESPPKVAVIPAPPEKAHTWQIGAAMLRGHSICIEWSKTKTPPALQAAAGSLSKT